MIKNDVTRVYINHYESDRRTMDKIQEYKKWLDERNIKYSFFSEPIWSSIPAAIVLRNEDALAFILAFGL